MNSLRHICGASAGLGNHKRTPCYARYCGVSISPYVRSGCYAICRAVVKIVGLGLGCIRYPMAYILNLLFPAQLPMHPAYIPEQSPACEHLSFRLAGVLCSGWRKVVWQVLTQVAA